MSALPEVLTSLAGTLTTQADALAQQADGLREQARGLLAVAAAMGAEKEERARLRPEAAAELLGLRPKTLAEMRSRGDGPRFTKAGGRVWYFRRDIEDYLESRRRGSTAERFRGTGVDTAGR